MTFKEPLKLYLCQLTAPLLVLADQLRAFQLLNGVAQEDVLELDLFCLIMPAILLLIGEF